ncbi:uncharacterized protein MJAP1_000130 [Malassezia japonica]|uniref:Uncharacterized protein n=1 Tax=Malassezia japonica TaxID=223818 RepID=A0AAF0EU59_9BASI|nr:uncharacterized protein MJAP1_000130 [Malassezia japonica]WFD37188.1 hypothetical protein MJAP1_000130 [Malassezia japonica]
MARLPRAVEQILTAYLTGAIAQRLSRSPAVLRATDRILHEWDTLPQRMQGKPVPYTPRTFDEYETVTQEDHGEPHDEPSPFPLSGKYSGQDADLKKARSTNATASRAPESPPSDERASPPPKEPLDPVADEIRALQEKLRRPK